MRNLLLGVSASLFLCGTAFAEDYIIDTDGAHASVQFRASHLGFSYVIGRFNEFTGGFSYDAENPEAATASVTINAKSIDSNHAERDKHLRSDDFLDVEKYPTITFTSTAFSEADDGSISVTGDISLHGVTESVVLEGRHVGHGDDPWGGYRRGMEAGTVLNAADYGLPKWVGDIEVGIIVEGIRQ